MKDGNYFSPTKKEFVTFILVILGMFTAIFYSACIIPGFCKNNINEINENEELLVYLKKINPIDVENISTYLYMRSCYGDSEYNFYSRRFLLSEVSDEHFISKFIDSISDINHWQPTRDLLNSLSHIKINLKNGHFIDLDINRSPSINRIAYIYLSASPEIEQLVGFRLAKAKFKFKSDSLYHWIAELVHGSKKQIDCCKCQIKSGQIKHQEDVEDKPCFLCIM